MPQGHELNFIELFLTADIIVKSVMVLLAAASVASWTVMIEKVIRFASLRRQTRAFEAAAAGGTTSELARGVQGPVVAAGLAEWRDRDGSESRSERRERIERAMRTVLAIRLRRAEWGLPLLATIGSVAPFVGLFGTVWGIMNSFSAIAQSQDTSLAVVAPGIAEALFATAIGLFAAIPAVVAYNKFATDLGRLATRLRVVIGELGNRLARERAASLSAAE